MEDCRWQTPEGSRGQGRGLQGRKRSAGLRYPLAGPRRQGAEAVHAGSIGTGPRGDLVRTALADAGVAASAPAVEEVDTGVCVVLVEDDAERTFVTTRGAERRISAASLATVAAAPVMQELP